MESDTSRFDIKDWPIVRRNVKRNMMTYLHEILDYGMSPFNKYELRLLVWHLENEGYTPQITNDCADETYGIFHFMNKRGDVSPWKIGIGYDSTFMFEGVTFTFKLMGCMLFKQRFIINEDNTLKLCHLSF